MAEGLVEILRAHWVEVLETLVRSPRRHVRMWNVMIYITNKIVQGLELLFEKHHPQTSISTLWSSFQGRCWPALRW